MKTWHLVIDVAKCENCNNCFLACKDEHVGNDWAGYAAPQPGQGPGWISIERIERGQYPFVDVAYLPLPCMHCASPSCMGPNSNGAVYKRPDGIVIIDPIKAKGQRSLVESCPYGVIRWNEELQLAQKCTLCAHLLDQGWTQTRCTQSCPTGALTLRFLEDSDMHAAMEGEMLEAYCPQHQSGPSIFYKNLYRFTRCFIGGSLAVKIDGKDECAEGARVCLLDGGGSFVDETVSDNYGDFRFDNLMENSGKYILHVDFPGHNRRTIEVELTKSRYLGIIFLQ
jgi:Fe-S-cluster-containing dehydrogenase component